MVAICLVEWWKGDGGEREGSELDATQNRHSLRFTLADYRMFVEEVEKITHFAVRRGWRCARVPFFLLFAY